MSDRIIQHYEKRYAELEARNQEHAVKIAQLSGDKLRLEAENAALREKYNELLYAVAENHPGESRHETARRYIRQAEAPSDNPPQQATPHQPAQSEDKP